MTFGTRFFGRLPVLLVGAALVVLGSPPSLGAQGQATTGIIRGVVTDPSGAPVANAQVILHETQTNFTRTLTTDAAGNFTGTLLPLGTYDATARAVGFAEAKRTGIPLGVGETVPLQLQLAAVTLAPVTVEATRPVVEVTQSEAATPLAAQVVSGLPNNGRNYINLTLLTPNVAIVQGPDGDELTVAGQRGIHNNVSVDGADFNNSFFGEQRGGQRPAFTFNLDAVQELVVVAGGANAEFGRSSGGFVNVITKSGTNETKGSLHYFGKFDALSGSPTHTFPTGATETFNPDFSQHQFGFTLGGPIKRDRVFYFLAYDQQIYNDVKQKTRPSSPQLDSLKTFLGARYPELGNDFGPISRTNDARAALAKFDFRLSENNTLSLKYNYTWAEQQNGTFDVDTWGASANGLEQSHSHAVNGSLQSFLSSRVSNELRFQFAREDRPRPYDGPNNHLGDTTGVSSIFGSGVPFHDTDVDPLNSFRFGLPFFLPIRDDHDTRVQLLDNVSISRGNHLIKFGGEWNRTSTTQVFIGFAGGRMAFSSVHGFENFVNQGSHYIECSDGTSGVYPAFNCAGTATITGPVLLYLQQSGVGSNTVEQAGTQTIPENEFAVYLQDTWKPSPKLTVNYGLRWEAQIEPDPITPPSQVFFHPWIDSTVVNAQGRFTFPSDGTIPSDKKMWQPRLGIAWDPNADGQQVFRFDAGLYYARIPALNLASVRSTNGSLGQTLFGSSATVGFLPPPAFDSLLPLSTGVPFQPTVYVVDRNFQNPRTLSITAGYERQLAGDLAASISYTHARTDHLTRFINRNDPVFGSPFGSGPAGIGSLFTVESSAKSRYNGVTVGLKRVLDPNFQFDVNYTLSFDKSDDDNERDPFTFRYAQVDSLQKEYNWSDRDQRHRVNAWVLSKVFGFYLNNRVSYYSAQPASASCGPRPGNPFAPPAGSRANGPADRICADGSILLRNTLRKDNAYFSWDIRISRPFAAGPRGQLEALIEIFNVTNADNFRDPGVGTFLNFDGTIRSG
ncbi:MAG TPA: TonB-dependent receptor, partial [Gemmatimonadales bacterium]|nr:TonB-dependent receptor [Gemmatimonadales bacterium]